MTKTLITAHAGAEDTVPNTMESLIYLAKCGADAIEVDVRRQGDRLVLAHETIADDQEYVSLDEFFLRIPSVTVNLDLKEPGLLGDAADVAAACGALGRILFTGDVDSADVRCALERGLPLWYNGYLLPEGANALEAVSALGLEMLNTNYRTITGEMLKTPGRLSLWTVDDEAALVRFLAAGVRNITTRMPLKALQLRENMIGSRKEDSLWH